MVEGNERFARPEARRREDPAGRKAALQSKRYEERFTDYVPMRKPPLIEAHQLMVTDGVGFIK
jgi:hypothetical protein